MMLTIQREIKLRFTNEIAESFDLPLFMTGIVPVSETSSHFGANRCDGDVGSGNSLHWLTYYIKIRQKVCQSHLIKLKFKPCICACSFVGTKSWIGSTIDRWFNRLLQGFWSLLEVKAFGFSKDTDFREISRFSMIATYRGPDIWIVSMKFIKITRSSNHPIFTIGCLINGGME